MDQPALVNLNAPCPCGSGRKYKRCCLARERREAAVERQASRAAGPKLFAWAEATFPHELDACTEAFLGHARARYGNETLGAFLSRSREMVFTNVADAFVHEWPVVDGLTPTEVFLARTDIALHPRERSYLAASRRAPLALVEVEAVTPGESIVFHDLLSRHRLLVTERTASRQLRRWDVLFARIAEQPGENLLTGGIYPLDRSHLEWVLATLRRDKDRRGNRSLTWPEYLHRQWTIVPSMWLELYVDPLARLRLTNTDGEPLCWVRLEVRLGTSDPTAVAQRLAAVDELESDGDSAWRWLEGDGDEGTVVASLRLQQDLLSIDVNSVEREHRVRPRIEAALGTLVREVRREETDVVEELRRRRDSGEEPEDSGAPLERPAELEALERDALERHYRDWPDARLPALDDLTPRQAAALPRMRPRLVRLLKTIESHEVARGAGGRPLDLSWLWSELGLRRP
jgi:hypothetical protein